MRMVGRGNNGSFEENIVGVWLRFLYIEEYTEQFIDNGYDDLETVKLMGEEDLKAIGIDNQKDGEVILHSVKILREQGAAWVYLLLGDEEDESGTSSSGKMSTSEDEGFSSSSSGKESSFMRMKRERKYKYIGNKSKTLIFVQFFLKLYFQH
jgi:hypothetical protein